jgi:hypothetical protein
MLRGQGEHGTFGGGDALACGGRGERWWLHWLTPVHRGIATQQHGPPRPRPLKTEPTHTPRALSPCEASRRASRVGPTTGGYGTPPAYTGTSPPTRGHLQSARGRSFPGKIPREGGQRAPIRRRRRLATCPKRLLGNSHQAGTPGGVVASAIRPLRRRHIAHRGRFDRGGVLLHVVRPATPEDSEAS